MEVVGVGRIHGGCGRGSDAEDGQHEDGRRDADEPKRTTGPTAAPETRLARVRRAQPGMQPPTQTLLLRQMLDAIGDPPGLWRAKPATLLAFEQALDGRPGLPGHEEGRRRDRDQDALVVATRGDRRRPPR